MKSHPRLSLARLGLLPVVILAWGSTAQAAIPAGYTGTPYKGTPQQIPGRVELADLDEGGLNVAFFADHRRENAVGEGYSPISGDDYRPGNLNLPNICKTNRSLEVAGEGSEDFWEDGKRYPSETDKFVYYMGYAHTVDWVRVTVDVKQAGKYNVSSNWACANPNCGLSLWFNDGGTKLDNPDRPLDGENKSGIVMIQGTNDYHKWRAYPNFAQVELTAGVQLLTFNLEVADHLQYGFLQFELVGGAAGGSGGTDAGGAAGAANVAGASSSAGSGSGGTASTGAAGSAGSVSNPTGGAPAMSSAGAGGAPPSAASGSGTMGFTDDSADAGGCTVTSAAAASRSAIFAGALVALSLLLRRRRIS